MDTEAQCPRCGKPLQVRDGEAISVLRRFKITDHDADEYGRPGAFHPVVACIVRECVQIGDECTFNDAGYDIEGVFVPDFDLVPLTEVYARILQYREDQERRRQRDGDPGE